MSKKILVADDEQDTAKFIKKILEKKGYQVSVVFDGLEAKKSLEQQQYDVVFLDCSMPHLTGPELVFLAREKNPDAKVIIFSGYSAVDKRLADDLGALFISKPLTIEAIEEAIEDKK